MKGGFYPRQQVMAQTHGAIKGNFNDVKGIGGPSGFFGLFFRRGREVGMSTPPCFQVSRLQSSMSACGGLSRVLDTAT